LGPVWNIWDRTFVHDSTVGYDLNSPQISYFTQERKLLSKYLLEFQILHN